MEFRSEADVQKRNLALAYIVTSIDATCKASFWKLRCPAKAWRTLNEMFQAVSEAAVDSKLCQFQAMTLGISEEFIQFSNRVLELVSELRSSRHQVSTMEQKRASLRGLSKDFDVAAETIMSGNYSYDEAVAKLMIRETKIQDVERVSSKAMITTHGSTTKRAMCSESQNIWRGTAGIGI